MSRFDEALNFLNGSESDSDSESVETTSSDEVDFAALMAMSVSNKPNPDAMKPPSPKPKPKPAPVKRKLVRLVPKDVPSKKRLSGVGNRVVVPKCLAGNQKQFGILADWINAFSGRRVCPPMRADVLNVKASVFKVARDEASAGRSMVLLLVGPPGVGKTYFAKNAIPNVRYKSYGSIRHAMSWPAVQHDIIQTAKNSGLGGSADSSRIVVADDVDASMFIDKLKNEGEAAKHTFAKWLKDMFKTEQFAALPTIIILRSLDSPDARNLASLPGVACLRMYPIPATQLKYGIKRRSSKSWPATAEKIAAACGGDARAANLIANVVSRGFGSGKGFDELKTQRLAALTATPMGRAQLMLTEFATSEVDLLHVLSMGIHTDKRAQDYAQHMIPLMADTAKMDLASIADAMDSFSTVDIPRGNVSRLAFARQMQKMDEFRSKLDPTTLESYKYCIGSAPFADLRTYHNETRDALQQISDNFEPRVYKTALVTECPLPTADGSLEYPKIGERAHMVLDAERDRFRSMHFNFNR